METGGEGSQSGGQQTSRGPAASRHEQVLAQDVLDSGSALERSGARRTWRGPEVKGNSRLRSSPARSMLLLLPQSGEREVHLQGGPGLGSGQ